MNMKPLSIRPVIVIGLFALTVLVLWMIYQNPKLANVQLFAMLAQAIVISALVAGVVSFYFGSSESSARKDNALTNALSEATAQPALGTTTTTVAATVETPAASPGE